MSRFIRAFMAVILCLGIFMPTAQSIGSGWVVRVANTDIPCLIERRPDGQCSGYVVAYLEEIAMYTGWRYEYVDCSWEDGLAKLERGEIDLVCTAQYTPERAAKYDYAAYPSGYEYSVIYEAKNNDNIFYNDFTAFDGMRIGQISGAYQNGVLDEYAKEQNFSYTGVYKQNVSDLFDALNSGEVDTIALGAINRLDDYKIVGKYGYLPFYAITTKGNDALLNGLNAALEEIEIDKPYLQEQLRKKYYAGTLEQLRPSYTRQEAAYVRSAGALKVGIPAECYPHSYYDESSQSLRGIYCDVLNEIAQRSGLRFEYVTLPDSIKIVELLRSNDIDIGVGVFKLGEYGGEPKLTLSNVILENDIVGVVRTGSGINLDSALKVAVHDEYKVLQHYLQTAFPRYQFVFCHTTAECMEMAKSGEADMMMKNTFLANYLLQNPRYAELSVIPAFSVESPISIAVGGQAQKTLLSILNKSIDLVKIQSIDKIVLSNTVDKPYRLTIEELLYKYRDLVWIVVALVIIIVLIIRYVIVLKQRMINDLRREKERYKLLIENSDDMMFDIDMASDIVMVSNQFNVKLKLDIPERCDIKTFSELFFHHPADEDIVKRIVETLRSGAGQVNERIRLADGEGRYFWYLVQINALGHNLEDRRLIGRIRDINAEVIKQEMLQNKTERDELTGFYNKGAFYRLLTNYLRGGSAQQGAVIFIDIDNFKEVNDNLGHLKGDEVLREIAGNIRKVFRKDDFAARFGGDEFCMLIANADPHDIEAKVVTLCAVLKGTYCDEQNSVTVSASIGVACYPQDGTTAELLIERADKALYEAKKKGKNQYAFYSY